MHSKTPRLRSDCTPKQQDCAQIALQNTTTALRLHSQATRLRSDCTPKHHNCAQIALPCQATRLRSDCTPMPSNKIALRLHSQTTRLRSDCTPKYRNCNPKSACLAGRSERAQSARLQDSAARRRAFSSSVINSHQEPVSGQACNPLDPH